MTKRKTPTKQVPQASTEAVESVNQESNTKVAQAITTVKKASTGGRRGRPKKIVVEPNAIEVNFPAPLQKVVDVESRTITYVEENGGTLVANKPPSLYSRFKDWLVFKLYYYTSYFRGY